MLAWSAPSGLGSTHQTKGGEVKGGCSVAHPRPPILGFWTPRTLQIQIRAPPTPSTP